ncbi:MAG: pyridoxal-phosphate dependent enzyme [Desulfobacterales bacterium]
MLPLFEAFPRLIDRVSHVPIGGFPTPVIPLRRLGDILGMDGLYLKHDGSSGEVYGGNKVRKLEFILGDALRKRKKSVLTFGYAGSNHALATSIYAEKLGFKSTSILLEQPNARYVGKNLLMGHAHHARLRHFRSSASACLPVMLTLASHLIRQGRLPYIVPPGGSSRIGVLGYVNAAFELRNQVEAGLLPKPDRIFVALGTMGTAVGLALGLKAAGMSTTVDCVRVTDRTYADEKKFTRLFAGTAEWIARMDPSFPPIEPEPTNTRFHHDFFGEQYAQFTEQGMNAVRLLKESEGIDLEGTYTGKAMAALIDRAASGDPNHSVVLFWNTYNAVDFSRHIDSYDYRRLPKKFHAYFESDAQPLDR